MSDEAGFHEKHDMALWRQVGASKPNKTTQPAFIKRLFQKVQSAIQTNTSYVKAMVKFLLIELQFTHQTIN